MKTLIRVFIAWLPLATAVTGICFLVYATVQQNYRQSLNDPQIQMAEDAVHKIGTYGAYDPSASPSVIPHEHIDIATSLAPWIAVYRADFSPVASSGYLHDQMPQITNGVFVYASNHERNLVTWQPESGVRQAIVVEASLQGFVVAGRNMREVERRIQDFSSHVFLAWLVLLVATFLAVSFKHWARSRLN